MSMKRPLLLCFLIYLSIFIGEIFSCTSLRIMGFRYFDVVVISEVSPIICLSGDHAFESFIRGCLMFFPCLLIVRASGYLSLPLNAKGLALISGCAALLFAIQDLNPLAHFNLPNWMTNGVPSLALSSMPGLLAMYLILKRYVSKQVIMPPVFWTP